MSTCATCHGTKSIRCPVCKGTGNVSVSFSPEDIKREAKAHFDMTLAGSLEESYRAAMFLCGKLARSTSEQIAEKFCSTPADVKIACKTVEERIQSESDYRARIIRIVQNLLFRDLKV